MYQSPLHSDTRLHPGLEGLHSSIHPLSTRINSAKIDLGTYSHFNVGIEISTGAMLLVILPGPVKDITVDIIVDSLSLSLSLNKVSDISGTVGVVKGTLAFSEVLDILADISSLGSFPFVGTLSLTMSAFVVALEHISIRENVGTLAMSLQLLISLAMVNLIINMNCQLAN